MLARVEDGLDVTALGGPGAYALLFRGKARFIGRGRKLMSRLYAHSVHRRGEHIPGCPPVPVQYDQVLLYPCTVDALESEYANVCARHSWSPPCPS